MPEQKIQSVLVTGGTGFVGRHVVRGLLARGYTPVCLVRSPAKLYAQHPEINPDRMVAVVGSLADRKAIRDAAGRSQALIHLVGIILARPLTGQTFHRVHVQGAKNVVDAARGSGVRRLVHMSALGTRPDGVSKYHRTKWAAEEYVRKSGLDWTIFRPSLIHGPDGEFMRLMKQFMCGLVPPVIPYFGSGKAKVQPVYVKDVAECFVSALSRPETIGQIIPLGGPQAFTWIDLYNLCRTSMPCSRHWKPMVSMPAQAAKAVAVLGRPLMAAAALIPGFSLLQFDRGQVQMAQEDSVCDHTIAERLCGIQMRSFQDELAAYADRIE
jgi:NADH dehydrogenase